MNDDELGHEIRAALHARSSRRRAAMGSIDRRVASSPQPRVRSKLPAGALPAILVGVVVLLAVIAARNLVVAPPGSSILSPGIAGSLAPASPPAATPPVSEVDLGSSGSAVAWSPDGSLLALQNVVAGASGNAPRITIVDQSGHAVSGPLRGWSPTWLTPGQLAYVRPVTDDESATGPIVMRDVATGRETTVWTTATNGSLLASSRGYVAVNEAAMPSVTVLRWNSTGDATVVKRFDRAVAIDWSTTGQLLLESPATYASNGGPAPAPLVVFDPATGSMTSLGNLVDPLPDARFSPDGRRISCICSTAPAVEDVGTASVFDLGSGRWTQIAGGDGLTAFRHRRMAWIDPTTVIIATAKGLLQTTTDGGVSTPNVVDPGDMDGIYATGGSSPVLYAVAAAEGTFRLVLVRGSGVPAIDTGIVSDQSISVVPNPVSPIIAVSVYRDDAWRVLIVGLAT